MKLKNLSVQDVINDPQLLTSMLNVFKFLIESVDSYEDLIERHKRDIPENLFNRITEVDIEPDLIEHLTHLVKTPWIQTDTNSRSAPYFIQLDKSVYIIGSKDWDDAIIDAVYINDSNQICISLTIDPAGDKDCLDTICKIQRIGNILLKDQEVKIDCQIPGELRDNIIDALRKTINIIFNKTIKQFTNQ